MAKKPSPTRWSPGALISVHELRGGSKDARHVTAPGTVLDKDEIVKLALDDATVLKLLSTGAIRQRESDSAVPADAGDQVSADQLRAFLERHGAAVPEGASAADMLAIEPRRQPGITADELRDTLREQGVEVGDEDDIEALVGAALDHGASEAPDIDADAGRIERDMKLEEIKDELTQREVPFETDANKPVLAKLLAQVRIASPSPEAAKD